MLLQRVSAFNSNGMHDSILFSFYNSEIYLFTYFWDRLGYLHGMKGFSLM